MPIDDIDDMLGDFDAMLKRSARHGNTATRIPSHLRSRTSTASPPTRSRRRRPQSRPRGRRRPPIITTTTISTLTRRRLTTIRTCRRSRLHRHQSRRRRRRSRSDPVLLLRRAVRRARRWRPRRPPRRPQPAREDRRRRSARRHFRRPAQGGRSLCRQGPVCSEAAGRRSVCAKAAGRRSVQPKPEDGRSVWREARNRCHRRPIRLKSRYGWHRPAWAPRDWRRNQHEELGLTGEAEGSIRQGQADTVYGAARGLIRPSGPICHRKG